MERICGMDRNQAEIRIQELRKQLEYHSNCYYNLDSPEISDYEYDRLMQELKLLEKEYPDTVTGDSPTQKVGGMAKREAGVLVRHNVPMLSLQDVFSKEEVEEFVEEMQEQLEDPEFVVEYKIDGLSMALRYEEGELKTAVTRGDGVNFGEDVTVNAKVIPDVKKKLKVPVEYLEIRGEVYMKNQDFERVNEMQELNGKKAFANPKIAFMWDSVVVRVDGDDLLSSMTVKNVKTGELTVVEADEEDGLFGLFGFIGYNPNSKLFEGMLEMENGYIRTDDNMHTNIPGVFAAGDIRVKSLRQVVTAAADGAIAAMQAEHYISSH